MQEICLYQSTPSSSTQHLYHHPISESFNRPSANNRISITLGQRSNSNHSRYSDSTSGSASTVASPISQKVIQFPAASLLSSTTESSTMRFHDSNRLNDRNDNNRITESVMTKPSSNPTVYHSNHSNGYYHSNLNSDNQRLNNFDPNSPYGVCLWHDTTRPPVPLPPPSHRHHDMAPWDRQQPRMMGQHVTFSPNPCIAPSPCSTCTSPIHEESDQTSQRRSMYLQSSDKFNSFKPLAFDDHFNYRDDNSIKEHHASRMVEDESTFSPSSMMTPSHHQFATNHLGTTGTSLRRLSNSTALTDSQARIRQSNTRRPIGQTSNSRITKNPLTRMSSDRSRLDGSRPVEICELTSGGKIPAITPVKTGKKVQYRKTKVCPWNGHGRCVMGERCNYAHTKVELRGRPDLTRTRLCSDGISCTKAGCRFAHDAAQLRATGAFFRTKLCKFWMRGNCPSGDHCRHAHGEGQLRHPECIGPDDESPREAADLSELYSNQNSSSPQKDQKIDSRRSINDDQKVDDQGVIYSNRVSVSPSSIPTSPESSVQKHIAKEILPSGRFSRSPVVGSEELPLDGDICNDEGLESMLSSGLPNQESHIPGKADLLANLSEAELTAAVSDLLLGHDLGQNDTESGEQSNFNSEREFDSLLGTSQTTEDELKRLFEALASTDSAPFKISGLYETSELHRFISKQEQESLPTLPFNLSGLGTTSGLTTTPPLVFPLPDESAADMKLNDILNMAVATQDPDLLECSAKILRASLQYKKKQQQQQQQQQNSFFTQASLAPSTASTNISSLPASPRIISQSLALYGQQMFAENVATDCLWNSE